MEEPMPEKTGDDIISAPIFYTTDQVADILHVHIKTVRELIKAKKLKAVKIGNEYRITGEQLRRFAEENET
ncbi:excisionase family DNA binding protein [Methanolinea mesophila]|uniref:helix-turn-helix domain-containing protein n=1 Tax=Methanolinea mesophila TaxID=547055 RepID=UPI001AE70C99|nr:helix-turn-helix domain-containing protein [Methanolinea mesophila]MBP1929165.1 excisionase family DNA binding protein [Methanolinea mesophila]